MIRPFVEVFIRILGSMVLGVRKKSLTFHLRLEELSVLPAELAAPCHVQLHHRGEEQPITGNATKAAVS